jgi:glycosyltransferase involved in cell wall biosynthesis
LLTVISGWILAKRFRAKLVVEIRDIWPLTLVEEGGFKPWNPGVVFLSLVERFGYSVADHVVGTMPNIAAHVENIGGDPNKCIGIPFGFDPEVYAEAEELPHEFQKFLPEPGKFVVGYAGSIGRTNSLDTFLDCAKKFVGNDKIHFLMVGSGDLREEYIAKTEGWPNITIAPRVEKSQVQSVLKCCSVLYFSVDNSKVWDYGLSLNKLIDYMYSEKPIIGSYSGFPSMINEAECGTLIPSEDVGRLEDEITRYSQMTEDELRNIGVRGRSWLFENRLYSKVADQYLDLIMD